ncbi:hypothetical protein MKW92_050288 [Papaver armeniacum]|nr:hypothetical protein MKW92_053518 [Papaver armeniacum]KAI3894639.1 hypothetical protein MKW92_050288 [Papaver armeniacum]
MGVRGGLLFLLVLGISWIFVDARNFAVVSDVSNTGKDKDKVCNMCEKFATQALTYLGQNATQTEILGKLHQACSKMHSFKKECLTMVDYYTPLFFLEVNTLKPENFCHKMDLCDSQHPDSCKMCHQAVDEVLEKLENPDTQLEVIEILLKACNAEKKYAQRCKKLVFEYGPLIMANAQQFLASKDICTIVGVCKTPSAVVNESEDAVSSFSTSAKTSLLADS